MGVENGSSSHDMLVGRRGSVRLGERLAQTPVAGIFASDNGCAVKVFDPTSKTAEETALKLAFFRQEARIHSKLRHPNIITFVASDETVLGIPYIVMADGWGGTLDGVIKSKNFSPSQAHVILTQVARAMDYVHKQGIIHRDIKPSNIFLGEKGAEIGDFGIALDTRTPSQIDTGDILLGSPRYTPVERYLGEEGNKASDLWSYGVTAYMLLSKGKYPYLLPEPPLATDYFHAIATQSPLSLSDTLGESMTPWHTAWKPVLAKLLAKNPQERYPNFATLLQVLEQIGFQAEAETAHRPFSWLPDQVPPVAVFEAKKRDAA